MQFDCDPRSSALLRRLRVRWPRPALAQEAPDALVKRVSQEVLQIIKTDPKVQAGDQARIREVVETKLLPNFDFERMTALAMGRNWRQATPEQQKQLVDAVPRAARAHVLGRADAVPRPDDGLQAAARRRQRDGRHRAHRGHPPGPGAGARSTTRMAKTRVGLEGLRRDRRRRVARHQLSRRVQRADQERRRRRPDQDAAGERTRSAGAK